MLLLALALAMLFYWIARGLLRPPLHPVQNLLMQTTRFLAAFYWRTTWTPFPQLPGRGVVVVCNHRSSVDPVFVQCATSRGIYWMVAKEFVDSPAFRWLLGKCEVIPVTRGGIDTAATKVAMRRVSDGQIVGMFPEGRINMTDELFLPGRPGAAVVAIKGGGVIVPCFIHGAPYRRTAASPFFMSARVRVKYGEPIDAAPYAERIAQGEDEAVVAAELLLRTMQAMAVLAGQPDFQPQLAGRVWKPSEAELAAAIEEGERRHRRK